METEMETELDPQVPPVVVAEVVETDEERAEREKEEERARINRRYAIAGQIDERSRMISALLERLIDPATTKTELGIIAGMLAHDYKAAIDLIPAYKELGGDNWGIDRGIFRKYFN